MTHLGRLSGRPTNNPREQAMCSCEQSKDDAGVWHIARWDQDCKTHGSEAAKK